MDYVKPTLRVTKLVLLEAGTHNQQFRRPYEMNVDPSTLMNLQDRIAGKVDGKVTPMMIGQVLGASAGAFIMPKAEYECGVAPVEGWGERRLLFVMEIESSSHLGSPTRQQISGWTDYLGVSLQGSLDESMVFNISKSIHLRTVRNNIPGYGIVDITNTHDCSHVLTNNVQPSIYQANPTLLSRPEDIYRTLESRTINDAGDLTDTRIALNKNAKLSKMTNNLASNYVADILQSYQLSDGLGDYGQSDTSRFQSALDSCQETSLSDNTFLSTLQRMNGGIYTTTFTLRDLMQFSPDLASVTTCQLVGAAYQVHRQDDTEGWGGKDIVTQAATIIGQGVVALMMELGLTEIHFSSNNMYQVDGSTVTLPETYQTFSTGDMSGAIRTFSHLFERTIMSGITHNSQLPYNIHIAANVFCDTRIKISLDNWPVTEFVVPSFCDSLMVPVLTNKADQRAAFVNDFEVMLGYLSEGSSINHSMPLVNTPQAPLSGVMHDEFFQYGQIGQTYNAPNAFSDSYDISSSLSNTNI